MNTTGEMIFKLRRAGVSDRQIAIVLALSYGGLRVRLSRDKAAGIAYPAPVSPALRRPLVMRALLDATQGGPRLTPDDAAFVIAEGQTVDEMRLTASRLIRQRLTHAPDIAWLTAQLDQHLAIAA